MLAGEPEPDSGNVVRLTAEDVVVQRGTNHLWRNPSQDVPCRFVVSLIEAGPITVGGQELDQTA
ncbi:hypothetical protein [Streptomyces werraensis]|uniref:hypothetical protein n=1 Tax=Streptomyces werraensis TaxID=68284 RepID=UPI001CE27294